MQHADGQSRRRSQFLHGCRGCALDVWERIESGLTRLFTLFVQRLSESLDVLAAALPVPPRLEGSNTGAMSSTDRWVAPRVLDGTPRVDAQGERQTIALPPAVPVPRLRFELEL